MASKRKTEPERVDMRGALRLLELCEQRWPTWPQPGHSLRYLAGVLLLDLRADGTVIRTFSFDPSDLETRLDHLFVDIEHLVKTGRVRR